MGSWWYTWFPLLILFLLLLWKNKRKRALAGKLKQSKKENTNMQELVKRFLGKDCYIDLLEGSVDGMLSEITDGGLVIEKGGNQIVVNLNYVMKIREYPHNKKGKRDLLRLE